MVANKRQSKGKIIWFVTKIGEGSGGQRTVFQNISYLSNIGYDCIICLEDEEKINEAREKILKWYGIDFPGRIINSDLKNEKFDVAIATYYTTAKDVVMINAKHKMYFVQDYEPWFFPMSEERLEAKKSYTLGLEIVTIGRWLAEAIKNKFGLERASSFSFCADLEVYKKIDGIKKEDAICFVFQPNKPWRCTKMGLKALQIVQSVRPDIKIYLYGSEKMIPFNLKAEHLGLLSVCECNELYNKCKVGLCLSATNPSRIPFEMMAAGLPVVDLYLENNLYDFPEDGCLLAQPSAEGIAAAILKVLDNDDLGRKLSVGGERYMREFPLERGFEEFGKIIDACCNEKVDMGCEINKIYNKAVIKKPLKIIENQPEVYFRTEEELLREKEQKKQEEENRRRMEAELERRQKEDEWRKNLTLPQRVYLKIRYFLLGY